MNPVLTIRQDKKRTTSTHSVFSIRMANFNELTDVSTILDCMRSTVQFVNTFLLHPLPPVSECNQESERLDNNVQEHSSAPVLSSYYFEPNRALNRFFAEHAKLLEQIYYLSFMGVTDAIDRHPDLRTAVTYHKFCKALAKMSINNPPFLAGEGDSRSSGLIRRIHAVHPDFLDDPEISAGLHISIQKNTPQDQVIYVCSPETLALAFECCELETTLIIDGHWQHKYRMTHGVWEQASARDIATQLKDLVSCYPNKVKSIRLLGCEAGYLSSSDELATTFNPDGLFFKDECVDGFAEKEMAEFRNRAIYYSNEGCFPFAVDSLAGEILLMLATESIKVTATHSRTYPFPAGQLKARFNIGSDATEWCGPKMWKKIKSNQPDWYKKLQHLKSITVTRDDYLLHDDKWLCRK